jgi:hypothetical protein
MRESAPEKDNASLAKRHRIRLSKYQAAQSKAYVPLRPGVVRARRLHEPRRLTSPKHMGETYFMPRDATEVLQLDEKLSLLRLQELGEARGELAAR